MAQVLTVVALVAVAALLWWRHADRLFAWKRHMPGAHPQEVPIDHPSFGRDIYRASAHDFLHGAADLTFGVVILALGFFLLMWVIATG
jgi:hypothetical protein